MENNRKNCPMRHYSNGNCLVCGGLYIENRKDKIFMFQDLGFLWFAQYTDSIEEFINLLAQSDNPNDIDTQYTLAEQVGLDINTLSSMEIEYIQNKVNCKR